LNADEFDILFDLMTTRMVMTVVISSWRAARYPENSAYILRNHQPAWARLSQMAELSQAEAMRQIRRACYSE
jgi:hydroxylysine kinase